MGTLTAGLKMGFPVLKVSRRWSYLNGWLRSVWVQCPDTTQKCGQNLPSSGLFIMRPFYAAMIGMLLQDFANVPHELWLLALGKCTFPFLTSGGGKPFSENVFCRQEVHLKRTIAARGHLEALKRGRAKSSVWTRSYVSDRKPKRPRLYGFFSDLGIVWSKVLLCSSPLWRAWERCL